MENSWRIRDIMRQRPIFYKLEGTTPVPCDMREYAQMFDDINRRRVAKTKLADDIEVSTVFLGIDHSHGIGQTPILFETMIFGGPWDQEMWRYATWEEAETDHATIVENYRSLLESIA